MYSVLGSNNASSGDVHEATINIVSSQGHLEIPSPTDQNMTLAGLCGILLLSVLSWG